MKITSGRFVILRKITIVILVVSVAACSSVLTPETPFATLSPATKEATAMPSSTPTATVTPTPTPMGSGLFPLVAYIGYQGGSELVKVVELISERTIASFPIEIIGSWQVVRFSPSGNELAYLAKNDTQSSSIYVYNLKTATQKEILQFPDNAALVSLEWSPSSQYISFSYASDRQNDQHWVYSFETESAFYVSRGYWGNWLPNEDVYFFQDSGGSRLFYDPISQDQYPAPRWTLSTDSISSHDFHFTNYGCSKCFIVIDNAFELEGYAQAGNEVFYHLFDASSLEEKAFVAHFISEFQVPSDYSVNFIDIFPLSRGDYILFVQEFVGPTGNRERGVFSIWNPAGQLPIEVSDRNNTNRLAEVMPVAVSKDEQFFLGLQVSRRENELPLFKTLIVDINTARIVYQYPIEYSFPLSMELFDALFWATTLFGQGDQPLAIDVFWE